VPKLVIGSNGAREVHLPRSVRETHLHVIGGTGSGKSRFLEHMIRRDIRAHSGVCLIDPHGELYDALVDWLAREGYEASRTVHLINLSDAAWSVGFNPLCSGDAEPVVRVRAMVDAIMKAWGAAKLTDTPRLARCLFLILYALAEHRLSLVESEYLTNVSQKAARLRLTAALTNSVIAREWQELNEGISDKVFAEYLDSTKSRLLPFISSPALRRIMGQTENVLDFRACMDRGDIVLVNLAATGDVTAEDARMFGAMLFSDLFISATKRDIKQRRLRPFYCYIDECADFVTDDIARMLDQTRKFGLHLILAHQRLQQLSAYSDTLYNGVMESARSKVVFRVDSDESADLLARHLFRKSFDMQQTVVTDVRPTVTSYERVETRSRTYGESEAVSEHASEAEGSSSGTTSSSSLGLQQVFDADALPLTSFSQSEGQVSGETSGSSFVTSSGFARARGSTQSETVGEMLEPQIEWLEVRDRKPLEEHIHEGIVAIRALPKRCAFVYLSDVDRPLWMQTPDVRRRPILSYRRASALDELRRRSGYCREAAAVEVEIEERSKDIISPFVPVDEDDEEDFTDRGE
jgi:hypothetical protein